MRFKQGAFFIGTYPQFCFPKKIFLDKAVDILKDPQKLRGVLYLD